MPVNQAITNTYFYKEVRKIQSGAGVLYPGYPIYHLFKTQADGISSVRADDDEYWMPLPLMQAYVQYTAGDEFVEQSRIKYDKRASVRPSPSRRKYTDSFPVYTHKYIGNRLYVATAQLNVFPLEPSENPYSYRNVQVWVESSATYTTVYDDNGDLVYPGYWYHPFENKFYAFAKLAASGARDTQFMLDVLFTRDTSGQSTDSLMAAVAESIRLAQVDELVAGGKTREQAIALVDAKSAEALATRAAMSTSTPRAVSSRSSGAPTNISVSIGDATTVGRPQAIPQTPVVPKMVQVTDGITTPLSHEFVHKPNQISYTSIGSNWSTIERVANRPIMDWQSYKLMQASFSFLVSSDSAGSLDDAIDGKVITTSVDQQLNNLRKIALSPYPVVFMGLDEIMSTQLKFPFQESSNAGALFVISEFNVTSIYRNVNGSISRASCDITLTELPHELVDLIKFPKPPPYNPPPPKDGETTEGCGRSLALTTTGAGSKLGFNLQALGEDAALAVYLKSINLISRTTGTAKCPAYWIVTNNDYEKVRRARDYWNRTNPGSIRSQGFDRW